MERKVLRYFANGLVFYSFGFVLYGHDVLAVICAILLVVVLLHEFGLSKMMANWEYMFLTALVELVLIEKSGMAVCRSSLFTVSCVNLMHAYTWSTFAYSRMDSLMYQSLLVFFTVTTMLMNQLPLGFVETMLVILFIFLPYTVLAKEKERESRHVCAGKKHMTVIE